MTLKGLEEKVKVDLFFNACVCVVINYRNKKYWCKSNNKQAYNRIASRNCCYNDAIFGGYTLKGAFLSLYNECKIKNNLA